MAADGMGGKSWMGWEGRPVSPFIPVVSIHPSPPVLLSQKGGITLGVKAPDNSAARGALFWHCVVEKECSVFGIFFSALKKEKHKWSLELLQLGQMGRTAEGLIPIRTHTYTHAWTILVRGSLNPPQAQTFCLFWSNWANWENQSGLVLNPKYLWHSSSNSLFWEPLPSLNSDPDSLRRGGTAVTVLSIPSLPTFLLDPPRQTPVTKA